MAPQQVPLARSMHADNDETFVPVTDYISLSEEVGEEMVDDYDFGMSEFETYGEDYLREALAENLPSEETLIN